MGLSLPAVRAVGLTYRSAWDAVQALNNLFDRPLVNSQAGGAKGGSAVVTDVGRAVIIGFEKVEQDFTALMSELNRTECGGGFHDLRSLF